MSNAAQTKKKPGWQILKEAAEAVGTLPPLGSGELLNHPERSDLLLELEMQCLARTNEIVPTDHAPEVLESLCLAIAKTDIMFPRRTSQFLTNQCDIGAISGCLTTHGVTEWNVELCTKHNLVSITLNEDVARQRVTDEVSKSIIAQVGEHFPSDIVRMLTEQITEEIVEGRMLPTRFLCDFRQSGVIAIPLGELLRRHGNGPISDLISLLENHETTFGRARDNGEIHRFPFSLFRR